MSDPTDASPWVKKAEQDLLSIANNLASNEVQWDKVVFDAQQAAEKFLKALLVSHGQEPPKIHDLTKLLTLCVAYAPELASFGDDCLFLSPLAVRSRYPGDEPETAREDAEKGVQIARRIRAAVLERLQPEAP